MATKLQETINGMGGNIQPLLDEIKEGYDEVIELQEKVDALNAKKGEVRARMKAIGISKKAFDFGCKRKQMEDEERQKLDENYSVVCDALGVPLLGQGELFANQSEKENDNANKETSIGEQQAEAIQNAANAG